MLNKYIPPDFDPSKIPKKKALVKVGPGSRCSSRHRMPLHPTKRGFQVRVDDEVSNIWQALGTGADEGAHDAPHERVLQHLWQLHRQGRAASSVYAATV